MFQNVADVENDQNKIKIKNIKVLYRLKEIFKYQNLIIYILTLLVSTLSIKGEIMPFGLAMIAACVGETVPLIGVLLAAIIGMIIGNGITSIPSFLITIAVYFSMVLFFRRKVAIEERNETIKSGGKLFSACLIVSIVKSFLDVFLIYDVFLGFVSASLTYVFYKIFVNGLSFIKNINIKKAFTVEELIASVIIISLASLILNNINIFSLNLSNIVIIFMIMVLGWKHGMLIGGVSGISIGLITSCASDMSFLQISMFAISGILSGLLNKFGKIGVVVGFVLGNAILTYWVRGATTMVIYFREIFIASIGLLLMPKKFKIDLEDILGKDKLLDSKGDNRLEEPEIEVSQKLKAMTEVFNGMMGETRNAIALEENFIQDFLDNLEEIKENIFYEEIANESTGIAKDICKILIKNDILLDQDLMDILNNHNNYVVLQDMRIKEDLQEIVKIANRTLKMFEINRIKQQEKNKNFQILNENLKTATQVINKCADEITQVKNNIYSRKEIELMHLLNAKKIIVQGCSIKQLENKKFIIEIKLDYEDSKVKEKETILNISEIISKSMGTKIILQRERNNDENKEYCQVYASEDKYILQVGSSKIAKDDSTVSGDCSLQIKLADGKYLLAIADGMGTGEKARECSKLTLRLMKQLLSAGFNKNESIKIINSRLNIIENSERYSTLDATILDLFAGKIEILKNGACSTYIKNRKNVKIIKSSSMPLGIVDTIDLQAETLYVDDGDILVMCSDGVIESKNDEKQDWLVEFLKNLTTNNVQKMADLILAEAIDNNYGIAQDDMTVIVSKIVKRK